MNGVKPTMTTMKPAPTLTKQPKILIIGAGIAGISCGEYLMRNGVTDFKILEATGRTGGRIWSVNVDDNGGKAEMGANWIHGIEGNPIFKIADQNHLLQLRNADKSLCRKDLFLTESGEEVSEKIVKEVDWLYGMTIQQCEEFYEMNLPTPEENQSVGEYLQECLEEKLERYSNGDKHLRELILKQRISLECCVSGCNSLNDLSLAEYGSYEELPGIHYTIPPGFESVLEVLKKNIPQDNIVLNTEVACVHWNRNTNNSDCEFGVCVELTNGEKLYADHVLVTVSVGVLKATAQNLFNPPLSKEKLEAIEHVGFGVVNKVMLEFDEQIVDPLVWRIELLWDKDNEETDLAKSWFKKIYSFEVNHEHVLIGWLSGKEAAYFETLSEEQIGNDCVAVLQKFLKKDIPKPKRVIRTSWGSNQFTKGAYSFVAVGGLASDMEKLAEPLFAEDGGKPQVLFAGEATHKTFYSTTHGALLTGQREAQRLIDMYSQLETTTTSAAT